MPLQVYNTLTRSKEVFTPINSPRVGMYVCGPTVYGHAHLGHAKSYIHFDVINRWLRVGPHVTKPDEQNAHDGAVGGYDVKYIQNITDVGHLTDDADEGEDKLAKEARRRGLHPMAVADYYIRSYNDDMAALNVMPPDIAPRATGHIIEQIALVQELVARGHAYESNGSVYFDVSSVPDYGKLSGRTVDDQEAGARVGINQEKRHPSDFALWKRAEASHLMQWDSPWGKGFPGWHIECSAMSIKYLGEQFDIHGGGLENQFPHHECEICQSESATGMKPFARYWLHNNMVTINGQKMGKSLGNFVSLKELFVGQIDDPARARNVSLSQAYPPMVVRFLILQSHYRSPLDLSDASLSAAKAGYASLVSMVKLGREQSAAPQRGVDPPEVADLSRRVVEALNDDFNHAAALAILFEAGKLITTAAGTPGAAAALALIERTASTVLGLTLDVEADTSASGQALDGTVQLLIELRAAARKNKDFATSDAIRDRLAAIGVELLDGKDGTRWRLKP